MTRGEKVIIVNIKLTKEETISMRSQREACYRLTCHGAESPI